MPLSVPTVSVLVTSYNRSAYLEESVDSILASTYQDCEIVIVDDCSTDNSLDVATKLAARDTRIRVYANESNLGDYNNRNKAASFAGGKYLKYLDADDTIYSHSLGLMVTALEEFPDAALALSQNVIDPESPYPHCLSPAEAFERHFLGRSPIGVGPSAAIIRRSAFEQVGGFSGRRHVGDTELWLRLAEKWPIVLLPPALVWWRRHDEQEFAKRQMKPHLLQIEYELQVQALARSPLSCEKKAEAAARLSHHYARQILSMAIKQKKPMAAWRLFWQSDISTKTLASGFLRRG